MRFMRFMKLLQLKKNFKHNIDVLIDRITVKKDIKQRLAESIEVGLTLSEGLIYIENLETKKYKYILQNSHVRFQVSQLKKLNQGCSVLMHLWVPVLNAMVLELKNFLMKIRLFPMNPVLLLKEL